MQVFDARYFAGGGIEQFGGEGLRQRVVTFLLPAQMCIRDRVYLGIHFNGGIFAVQVLHHAPVPLEIQDIVCLMDAPHISKKTNGTLPVSYTHLQIHVPYI